MANLSWNEIRERATRFQHEWKDETSEHAEAKTFWDQFFNVFGITRRRVASFEKKVKKIDGQGFIDLLWKGTLLVEHKSKGKDLERAYRQAKDYFPGLKEKDLPKYILVSDFENFVLYDLDTDTKRRFKLEQFRDNVELFGFIAGYQKQEIKEQDPVNIEAAIKMGQLHDKLKNIGYDGHDLEVYLVRLLFCLFADDTSIFEKNLFRDFIEHETREDGRDLASTIDQIFEILNTPEDQRLKNLDELLLKFPYVNGNLFEKKLRIASFDSEMRNLLLDCSSLNWGLISPAVFGSLFQSVMNPSERRELGAHYTSEENIMKVIKSLFLDELWEEFNKIKNNYQKLEQFHEKLSKLNFFDPACGCGNFLIIAYREIRLLELEVIRNLLKGKLVLSIDMYVKLDVDQFYGIEIDEFASQIAQVALWLIDHQMNMQFSKEFGEYFKRLPLKKKPNIVYGNSLLLDWENILPSEKCSFILGNPPFVGARIMNETQKEEIKTVTHNITGSNDFDYVAGWYIKAAHYIQNTNILVGLVSTNSVVQGLHATNLWEYMFEEMKMNIFFAHHTFKWMNEARGRAGVYCVIIGFSCVQKSPKYIFSYPDISGKPTVEQAKEINQYLLNSPTVFIKKRTTPISKVPTAEYGVALLDNGHYTFTEDEKNKLIEMEPSTEKYFNLYIGSRELINNTKRYCLYLSHCNSTDLRKMPTVLKLIEQVRDFRLKSKRKATKRLGDFPREIAGNVNLNDTQLLIPRVSSERRKYIPIGFFEGNVIGSDQVFRITNATLYIFGVLNSSMHMAWTRMVSGKLKSDYRYSSTIVYNNFIFPDVTEKQIQRIERCAQKILDVRNQYLTENTSLADLYDPLASPTDLLRAHQDLDKEVDKSYGKKFSNDFDRVKHLFELYVYTTKN